MAVVARDLLHLDKVKPDISTFAIYYRPEDDTYVEQCPWRQLGLPPLPPGKPDLHNMRFLTNPEYGSDGKSASIDLVTKLVAVDKDGKARKPFIQVQTCRMSKPGETWHLDGCATSKSS